MNLGCLRAVLTFASVRQLYFGTGPNKSLAQRLMTKDICEMYGCTKWQIFIWIIRSRQLRKLLTEVGRSQIELELILMKFETKH